MVESVLSLCDDGVIRIDVPFQDEPVEYVPVEGDRYRAKDGLPVVFDGKAKRDGSIFEYTVALDRSSGPGDRVVYVRIYGGTEGVDGKFIRNAFESWSRFTDVLWSDFVWWLP